MPRTTPGPGDPDIPGPDEPDVPDYPPPSPSPDPSGVVTMTSPRGARVHTRSDVAARLARQGYR